MSGNVTNTSANGSAYSGVDWQSLHQGTLVLYTIYIPVGTILNLWFLIAIVTAPELRSRFRLQALCTSLLANLSDTIICMSFYIAMLLLYDRGGDKCYMIAISDHLSLVQDFVGNWSILMVIATLLAETCDFDPATIMSPLKLKIGRIALLVVPWVFPTIYVPALRYNSSPQGICSDRSLVAARVFKILDSIVPTLASVVLLSATAIIRRRGKGSEGVMKAELVGEGKRQADNVWPYAIVLLIAVLSDVLLITLVAVPAINTSSVGFASFIYLVYLGHFIIDSRVMSLPLAWLLIPDVRERIRIWRPWYRPAAGIDLSINYSRSQDS